MSDILTGAALAERIESIVSWRPDLHDQGYWFASYDDKNQRVFGDIKPEELPLKDILREVDEQLEEEHPCNTTLCVAGWAVVLNGYSLHRVPRQSGENHFMWHFYAEKDGKNFHIDELAMELLGLDMQDAEKLFSETISNEQALEALEYIVNGIPIDWDEIVGGDESAYYEEPYGYPY